MILETRILQLVSEGIKSVDLLSKLAVEYIGMTSGEIELVLMKLIANGNVVEVEYYLPSMQWRSKSFFLPKGTEIRIGKS